MKLIAIRKNGTYYCRNIKDYTSIPTEDKLKFNTPRLISFNSRWVVFNTLPISAEELIPGRHEIVEYKLKEGFEVASKTPHSLPKGSFDCDEWDDGDCVHYENRDIENLYEAIEIKHPDTWNPIELEIDIIDEDCEPLINPKYDFKTEFPYFIENHEIVRHKYPCLILGDDIFQLIRIAVKENLPKHCKVTSDYDFHFTVEIDIPLIHEETHKIDKNFLTGKKPKYITKPLRSILVKVIDIQTNPHARNQYSGTIIQDVVAENYEQLEIAVDTLLQDYINKTNWKPTVCPHCKGFGWIEEGK